MVHRVTAPAQWNLVVWKGSNEDVLVFRIKDDEGNIDALEEGDDFVFFAQIPGGVTIRHSIEDGGLTHDVETGCISYAPSIEESRLYARGDSNTYSVERRTPDGGQLPYFYGTIIGKAYPNDDV